MSASRSGIPAGLIFEIAGDAGLEFPGEGDKRPFCCPFHTDSRASAFLSSRNVFYCSVCTPDGGWSARRFAAELGLPWRAPRPTAAPVRQRRQAGLSARDAERLWNHAQARARDDDTVDEDSEVHAYLAGRGLGVAFEERLYGVIAHGMPLPSPVANWPRFGHRLIAPLYDQSGRLTSIQGRTVTDGEPRTLFPKGSRARGTMFANWAGLRLLRGGWPGTRLVVLGEGLTDHMALAITLEIPVLCTPGSGLGRHIVGPWVAGCRVLLALDADDAGDRAVVSVGQAVFSHPGTSVARITWPSGCKDACEVLERRGGDGLARFLDDITDA